MHIGDGATQVDACVRREEVGASPLGVQHGCESVERILRQEVHRSEAVYTYIDGVLVSQRVVTARQLHASARLFSLQSPLVFATLERRLQLHPHAFRHPYPSTRNLRDPMAEVLSAFGL